MSQYQTLKAQVSANIKQNDNQEIRGDILQAQLLAMINSLGVGYQYMGLATPATDPGTPDQNVFFLATEAGTYTNFNSLVVNDGEVCALVWNGAWAKQVTGAATAAQVSQLGQKNPYGIKFVQGSISTGGVIDSDTTRIRTLPFECAMPMEISVGEGFLFHNIVFFHKDGTIISGAALGNTSVSTLVLPKQNELALVVVTIKRTDGTAILPNVDTGFVINPGEPYVGKQETDERNLGLVSWKKTTSLAVSTKKQYITDKMPVSGRKFLMVVDSLTAELADNTISIEYEYENGTKSSATQTINGGIAYINASTNYKYVQVCVPANKVSQPGDITITTIVGGIAEEIYLMRGVALYEKTIPINVSSSTQLLCAFPARGKSYHIELKNVTAVFSLLSVTAYFEDGTYDVQAYSSFDEINKTYAKNLRQIGIQIGGNKVTTGGTADFTAYFGWRAELADQGDVIEGVNVSVDGTTGTPSGTASFVNGILSFVFSGLKGEKGEQGLPGTSGVASSDGVASINDFSTTIPDDTPELVYVAGAKGVQVYTRLINKPNVRDSIFIGNSNTGGNITSANTRSVFIGADNGMTAEDSATFCVGVGYHSNWALTTGNGNTGVGAEAIDRNETGNNNTAVGVWACAGSTDPGEPQKHSYTANTGVGAYALQKVASNNNVSIGSLSSFKTKSGGFNTVVGANALENNVSGGYNICIGYAAGRNAMDGNELYIAPFYYNDNENEKTKSLIYGKFGVPAQQLLAFNAATIKLPYIPTSDPHIAGALWNDNNTIKISNG